MLYDLGLLYSRRYTNHGLYLVKVNGLISSLPGTEKRENKKVPHDILYEDYRSCIVFVHVGNDKIIKHTEIILHQIISR